MEMTESFIEILHMFLTVMCSVLASSGLWAYIQHRRDRKDAKTQLLIGLAHDRIMQCGQYYIQRGAITADEYENLYNYLYLPYHELGGNGSAERMIEEVKKLPIAPSK